LIDLRHIPRIEARAAMLSLGVGVGLMLLKFAAYFLTGSAAVFSDAMESIVNVLAGSFAFYALWLAHRPPDPEHPYGHGKIEFVSAALEGGMIVVAALVVASKTLDTLLFHRLEVHSINLGLVLVGVATGVNAAVGLLLFRIGRQRGSLTLEADGRHLITDAVTSVVAIVALLIVSFTGWTWVDPAMALMLSIYLLVVGARLLRRAAAGLLDEQDITDERMISEILDAHATGRRAPAICSYHKLRHRHSGRYHWVDVHLQVPADLDIREGHEIASAIEYEIEQSLGEANATAHIEPCEDAACATCGGRR
jgi:cation diffusion facilitator family transporter